MKLRTSKDLRSVLPPAVPDNLWHNGPPPSLGWWPASCARDPDCIRWWDGKMWSYGAYADMNKREAAKMAGIKISNEADIKWQHRPASWPERSMT